MQDLTPEQIKKRKKLEKLVDGGSLALIESIFELEEKIEELKTEIPNLDSVLESVKGQPGKDSTIPGPQGDPGDDYILTEQDKEEIASKVVVPVVEKVIEKIQVIKEIPIVTENVVEVAVTDEPETLVAKINSAEVQIEPDRVKGLTDLKEEVRSVKIAGQSRTGWGAHPLVIEDSNGAVVDKVARRIKFANSTVARSADGKITVTPTGSGGVTSFGIQSGTALTGAVTISEGLGVSLSRSGNNISIGAAAASPASFIEIAATGARNTTNKDFTFTVRPVLIIVNGFTLHYSVTADDYSFTWNAGTLTATIPQPVGTTGVIYGLANV